MRREHTIRARIADAGYQYVTEMRKGYDCSEADVLRAALRVAARHNTEMDEFLAKGEF